jgi:hypothetical protein
MDSSSIDCSDRRVNNSIPKCIAYIAQVLAIFTVIVACIVNLSIGTDKSELWSSLLSGALGYLLPAPKLKNNEFLPNSAVKQLREILSGQHSDTIHYETTDGSGTDRQLGGGAI